MAQVDTFSYNIDTKSRFALLMGDHGSEPAPVTAPAPDVRKEPKIAAPPKEKSREDRPSGGQRGRGAGGQRNVDRSHGDENTAPNRGQGNYRGSGRPFRGDRGGGRGGYNSNYNTETDGEYRDEHRSEVRGRGRGGGGGPGRGRGHGDHRDFDRHSGSDKTGVKPVMKKDGHGVGNWGTVADDIEGQMAPIAEDENKPSDKSAEDLEGTEEKRAEPVEEEPATRTLEEYFAQKKNRGQVTLSGKTGSRKPNDGKDVFKNMTAHHKIVQESDDEVDVAQIVEKAEDKSFIVFEFEQRNGGGRPGRGGNYRTDSGGGRPFRGRDDGDRGFRDKQQPREDGERSAPRRGRGGGNVEDGERRPFRGGGSGRGGRGRGGASEGSQDIEQFTRGRGGRGGNRGGRGRGGFTQEPNENNVESGNPPVRRGGRGGGEGNFRGGNRGAPGGSGRGGGSRGFNAAGGSHSRPQLDSREEFPALS